LTSHISLVNQTLIEFWKSCNGVRKVTELVDWRAFAIDNRDSYYIYTTKQEIGLTDEQIEEGEDIIGN